MKRKSSLLFALIITTLVIFIILTTRTGAISLFAPEDLTPTAVPPEILTQIAQDVANQSATQTAFPILATQVAQTEQASQLTLVAAPTLDLQEMYPIFTNITPSASEILAGKPDYPLAGNGILYDDQNWFDSKYEFSGLIWEESTYDSNILTRGGQVIDSPTQGAIRVIIRPRGLYSTYLNDITVESPIPTGKLTIIGAVVNG